MTTLSLCWPEHSSFQDDFDSLLIGYLEFTQERLARIGCGVQGLLRPGNDRLQSIWNSDLGLFNKRLIHKLREKDSANWIENQVKIINRRLRYDSFRAELIEPVADLTMCGITLKAAWYSLSSDREELSIRFYDSKPTGEGTEGHSLSVGERIIPRNGLPALRSCNASLLDVLYKTPPEALDPGEHSKALGHLVKTFEFMKQSIPNYYNWTSYAINEIVVVRNPHPQGSISGSLFELHGHIFMSHSDCLITTFTVLIHEASHQYFHLLMMKSPLVVKDAPHFYSSLKGIKRPLIKVLLGYHAFANICIALHDLIAKRRHQHDEQRIKNAFSYHLNITHQLGESLKQGSPYLTEFGRAFYDHLKKRLLVCELA